MSTHAFQSSPHLTFETVQTEHRRLMKILRSKKDVTGLVWDLENIVRCDSVGLALLIQTKRFCTTHTLSFETMNMPQSLYSLAEFYGVNVVL